MERKHLTIDRKILTIILLLVGIIGCSIYALNGAPVAQIAAGDSPLRLHILANSDDVADQTLKLALRDHVIGLVEESMAAADTKEEAMQLLAASLPELTEACNEFLAPRADYTARLELTPSNFPTITYGEDYTLPAGEYDALRIILGEGKGKNWWCVLFPPLCFVDLASESEAVAAASGISDPEDTVEVRFKLLDWLESEDE